MSVSERTERTWPELILSGRPFLGNSSLPKADDLDCRVRFSDSAVLAALIARACERGAGAVLPMNDPVLLRALDQVRASCDIGVYPVIPNVIGYVRQATDHGLIGAGLRLVNQLGIGDLCAIAIRGVTRLRGAMARDFVTLLSLFIEVEMAAFRRFRPPLILLHSQVTDIATAFGNREALRTFAAVVRRRFGAEPGLVTNNFALLLERLTAWKLDVRVIVAPFNPRGFLMKPTRAACEALLAGSERYVVADRVGVAGESLAEGLAYVRGLKIGSAIVEVTGDTALEALGAGSQGFEKRQEQWAAGERRGRR